MSRLSGWLLTAGVLCCVASWNVSSAVAVDESVADAIAGDGALAGHRHRVLVSTDIGGTDPDDVQSMVHLLLYSDVLDIEGLVSSPYGLGRKQQILDVIDAYETDYTNLKSYSERYPTPAELRSITKQGAENLTGAEATWESTEGSEWIVRCARSDDPRPLHVLVWGGLEDVAQALHDAPDILPKLRVYWIGGPNKKWGVNAYNLIEQDYPGLWMIEANATYRGWFVGGRQEGAWSNRGFVAKHVAGHGALGECFVNAKDDLKMGDTPSVARLLRGVSEDPTRPSWGGAYVRIWDDRKTVFENLPHSGDTVEVFGVTEFVLPKPKDFTEHSKATMVFDGGKPPSEGVLEGNVLRFRFSPRDAKVWTLIVSSDSPSLNGLTGEFEAVPPSLEKTMFPSSRHPQWWIDDPSPDTLEGVHPGARSVNRWREDFLEDFAQRMDRCLSEKK